MKIIRQSHFIETPINGEEILKFIEECARVAYKSEHKIGNYENTKKFIKSIVDREHLSTIEHFNVSVRFITDRGCYDEKTEVLTKLGWKFFKDLNSDDEFACLDNDNNILFCKQIGDVIVKPYNGNLLSFKSSSIDLLVTPDHKMWVFDYDKRSDKNRIWKFINASDIKNNHYVFDKTGMWKNDDIEIVIPQHHTQPNKFPQLTFDKEKTKYLFELFGLWITDGSYNEQYGSGSHILITQSKKNGVRRINEICKILNLRISWYKNNAKIDNKRLMSYVKSIFPQGAKTFTAYVPDLIKNASRDQIQYFLNGVILGDGNIHKSNNHTVICTSSKRFADDLQELFLKVNLSANIRTIKGRDRKFPGNDKISKCKESYVVSVHGHKRKKHLLFKKSAIDFGKEINYSGYVYCVTVPYNRLYVRRNGKAVWCGNCSHELVRHRLASFTQSSTRYCNYSDDRFGSEITVISPFKDENTEEFKIWYKTCEHIERCYMNLINNKIQPQLARSILPNCLQTEIVVTANLREWIHILKLRTSKGAHPQMRELMIPLLNEFKEKIPIIFDNIII